EEKAKAPGKTAQLQIIPADAVVHSGDTVTFKLRAFDEDGNLIGDVKPADAAWALPEPPLPPGAKKPPPALKGDLRNGKLTVDAKLASQQGYVTAKVGGVVGKARVRVAPRLPYKQDFENVPPGAVPGGWVNTQGKFVVAELAGGKVLRKVNDKAS